MFRRHWILLLCSVASPLVSGNADAGLCDWLFGRTPSPYVAGYAPYGYGLNAPYSSAYAAAYPSVAVAGAPTNGVYQAQMQSYDNASVYSGRPVITGQPIIASQQVIAGRPVIAPQTNLQTSYSLPMTGTTAASTYGSYYGGASLFGRVPATVPLAGRLRGPATSSNPFYGTGNVYPQSNPSGVYQSAYPSAITPGSPAVTAVPTGLPPSALPATPVAPLFTTAPQPRVGGLARFFGSLLGTNYRSSYYRAPVTYYRPVTSVDPVSGTTVTVQQPCTSYVQQLQRTPYSSLQPASSLQPGLAAPTVIAPPAAGCQTTYPGYSAAPIGGAPIAMGGVNSTPFAGQPLPASPSTSAIGQVGGYSSANDRLVVPIPSTQQPGYYQQPSEGLNTAPLTGAAPDDRAPVEQPRLESARPSEDGSWWRRDDSMDKATDDYQDSAEPSSYLKQIEIGDRTVRNDVIGAGIGTETAATNAPATESVRHAQALTDVRPIKAPEGFENPFQQQSNRSVRQVNRQERVDRNDLIAPPLPPARREVQTSDRYRGNDGLRYDTEPTYEPEYSASVQVSAPVLEAKLRKPAIRLGPPATAPVKPQRDNTWYSSE